MYVMLQTIVFFFRLNAMKVTGLGLDGDMLFPKSYAVMVKNFVYPMKTSIVAAGTPYKHAIPIADFQGMAS